MTVVCATRRLIYNRQHTYSNYACQMRVKLAAFSAVTSSSAASARPN